MFNVFTTKKSLVLALSLGVILTGKVNYGMIMYGMLLVSPSGI